MSGLLLSLALLLAAPGSIPSAIPPSAAAPVTQPAPLATPQFRRFGMAEGLPSSAINAVEQDHQGFLWFGGSGGLSRYDGVHFQTYKHDPARPDSLSTNDITQLLSAPDGRLWIATGDTGVDRLDPRTGRFDHWRHDPKDPASLCNDVVYSLALGPDGSLWVGTSEGLDHLLADGRRVEHVPYLQAFGGGRQPKDSMVGALLAEPDGTLWIGTWSGVLLKRLPDGSFRRIPMDPGHGGANQIWRIEGGGRDIRVGTKLGLFHVDDTGVARSMFSQEQLPAGYVFASTRDSAGRLWMATLHGVVMAGPYAGIQHFHSQILLLGGLPGEWTWRVISDREGGLWFTFYDGGVAYLAPGWEGFSRYTHIPDDADSLADTVAAVLAPASDGKLWVGSRGRIDKLDPFTGHAEHVLTGLKSEVISMVDDGQSLWFTLRGMVMRYRRGKLTEVDPAKKIITRPEILEKGSDGTIFVSVSHSGLARINPATLAVSAVPFTPTATDVDLRPMVLGLHDGSLWYLNHQGLMRWDASSGRMEFVPGVDKGREFQVIAFGKAGFWLAAVDTLEHYRWQDGRAVKDRTIGTKQGWPSPVLNGFATDKTGHLWIFSQTGLWSFDPVSSTFKKYGMQDGLITGEFNGSPVTLAAGDTIYAPTQGGVVAFTPGRLREHGTAPPVNIVEMTVRDHHGVRAPPVDSRAITLGWRDRELKVDTRALSYVNPALNRYRFRLEGFDSDWVSTDDHGDRVFSNLPPGDYRLEVQAAGAARLWGSLPVPIRIRVEAPPWARWWAWLVYLAGAVLVVWLVLWVWRRRLAQQHRIQLAEQLRGMAEQASAAKTQFLAMLSHEIRTPMTGVMGMAELLLTTPLRADQREYTQAMQRSGGMLLKLLNDALDLARIEAGRLELEPAPFDPRQLVNEVAQLEIGQAQAKGLRFVVELADELPPRVVGDALRIKQVLLNLANNALKFTDAGSVTVRAGGVGGGIVFSVSDTGPGIAEASQLRLFQRFEQVDGPQRSAGSGLGLAICRELVGMMGGSIELESRLAHGSTFHVRLPLPVPPGVPAAAAEVAAPVSRRSCQVLLVEDDVIVAAVIRGLLERQQHQVCHAGNGLGALAELAQARFDVILLDLDLPGIDGFQIARLVRQREQPGQHVPIVAITARSGGDEEARARAAGMDRFLRKPFSGEQLGELLSALVPGAAIETAEAAADPA